MAASTSISDTGNISNNQFVESINNSYITNFQSSSVVKSEPLDGESFIETEGAAQKTKEDTNVFQRTDFGLWDMEQRCLEEKNVAFKTDEYTEDLSVTQLEEASDEENGKISCDICGKVFTQIIDFRKHMKIHKQSVKCDLCNRCFSQKSQLQTHMEIHNRKSVNKCAFCEKTFKRKNALQMHMDSLHTKTSCDICQRQIPGTLMFQYHTLAHEHEKKACDFCCDACGEIYKTVDSFGTHLEIHKNDGRPFACEICGKTFTTITSIGRHMSSHKNNPSNTHQSSYPSSDSSESNYNSASTLQTLKVSHVCELCDETFLSKLKLETHYESHETECRESKQCEKTFDTGTALKKHEENAQKTTSNICGKEVSKHDLKTHKDELHTKDKYNVCAKKHSELNGEQRHIPISISKEEKNYSCDICGKRFTQMSGLRRHMIFHQQNIECDRCGRHFSTMHSLRSHMKIHLRTEFPKCEICDKSVKTQVVLQRHMRTYHTTETCDICGQQINRQLMGNHKQAHDHESKSRDFICSICEESYKTADSFRTHLEIHKDDDRPYTCEVCGKTFIAVRSIKDHARSHRDSEDTLGHQDSEDSYVKHEISSKELQMSELNGDSFGKKMKSGITCSLCGKIFSKKLNLDLHLKRHWREEKKCDQCKETFKTDISLRNHIDNVHKMKPCEVCGKIVTKGELKLHMADHHVHKKQYNCDLCGKQFASLFGLKVHMSVHVNNKKYSCDICGKRFLQTTGLKNHMRFHQHSIRCDRCGRCFSTRAQLQIHTKIHLRTTFPTCELCDKPFKTKVVLQMHMRIYHTTEMCDICGLQINRQLMGNHKLAHDHESKSRDFICSICEESYKTVVSFRNHLEIHKDEDRSYTCEICGKKFVAIKSIKDHGRLHRDCSDKVSASEASDKNESSNKSLQMSKRFDDISFQKTKLLFTCEFCGKMFSKKWNLDVHLKTHQRVAKEMKCDQCENTFKTESGLENHINNEHTSKPCAVCGKIFAKGELKHHRAEHIHKEQYECDMCGKQFSKLKGLRAHMSVHLYDKKYVCDICGKRFLQTTGLKMHMRYHQQSIKCDRCGRCFSKKAQLNYHMKIHLRTEFPKCEICDRSFKTKVVLQRHMRIYHTTESCDICGLLINRQLMVVHKLAHDHESKSRDFICSICEESYKTADSFRTHLEIHKNDDRPYICEVCGKTFIAVRSIKDHARSHRNRADTHGHRYLEDSCIKNENTIKNLQMSELGEVSIGLETKSEITCHLCGKMFSTKLILDLHLKRHRREEKKRVQRKETIKTEISQRNHNYNVHRMKPCEVRVKTLTKGDLKHHRTDHGEKRRMLFHERVNDKKYRCDICGKQFAQTRILKMHMNVHQQSIKCESCGCCFSSNAHLNSHKKIHLRTVFPKCEFCDKSFKTTGVLQKHMRIFHTSESCDICGLQIHQQLIGNHKLAHEYESNSRDFICSVCEDSFKTADSFRTHLEIHKDEDRPYTCEICGKTFIAIKSLKDHARWHRRRADIQEHQDSEHLDENRSGNTNLQVSETLEGPFAQAGKSVFICDFCGKILSRQYLLNVHLRIHQNVEKNCDKCEKTFKTEIALKNHIDLAHNEKPCEVCGKIMTKADLKHHRAEHMDKKQYECDTCGKQFFRLNGLKRHKSVHLNDKKYVCDICGKRFLQSTGLRMHMEFHRQSIKCDKCGRCFSQRSQLNSHMKIHLRTTFPKCELCDKSFKTKGVLKRHMRSFHTIESCDICGLQIHRQLIGVHKLAHEFESNSLDFICSECEDSFKTAESFRTHLEIHKDEDRPYTCEICGKTFIAIKSIKDHVRSHMQRSNTHQDSENSEKNRSGKKCLQMSEDLEDSVVEKTKLLFPCDLCGKKFSRQYLLDVHLRIHQNVEKNCDKCEKAFKTEIALKNHIDLAHNEKLCDVCGKILTKGDLKHHRAEHMDKKQYECDTCGKQFSRLNGLKRHTSVHLNDKKYVCNICGKRFLQSTGLRMHMEFHRQSIKCDRCERCFSKRAQLRLHMQIHLRTIFPKCELCDKSFKTKGVLQMHIRTFHTTDTCDICGLLINRQLMGNHKLAHEYESNSREFICSTCGDSFKTTNTFRTHLEIHQDKDRPYTCEVCGKTFIAIKSIKDHARLHMQRSNSHQHSEDSEKNGSGKNNSQMSEDLKDSIVEKTKLEFQCDFCGKILSRQYLLNVHLRIHQNVEKNCDKCEKTFKTEIALKNHIDLAHNEKPCDVCGKLLTKGDLKHHMVEHLHQKQYKCDTCGKQFSKLKGLITHMSVHLNDKKYVCDICGKGFLQSTGLRMHMEFHRQSIKCDKCGRCFSKKAQLNSHMKIHLRTEFPKCKICDKSVKTQVVLQRHMRTYHTTESCDICGLLINRQLMVVHKLAHDHESKSRYFICSICKNRFKSADSFRTHLAIHKNDDRPYTCEVCGKSYITVKNLRYHSRWHRERTDTHQDSETPYDNKRSSNRNLQMSELPEDSFGQMTKPVFTCDLFGKEFREDRVLQNHIKKIHQVLPGDICGEKLTHHQMPPHKKTVHPSDCLCDTCGVSFPDLEKQRRHSKKHRTSKLQTKPTIGTTVEEKFKCDICCKGFTSSRKLSCHRKFHKNTCNICGKCFSGKTALSTHMLRHESNNYETICKQRYKCKVCWRPIWTKLHLRNHYRKHMKLQKASFKCEGCALTFTSKVKGEAHFNALHVKMSCNICEKEFRTVLLKGHKKLHDLEEKGLILKDTQDKVMTQEVKRGHKRESMIPYLKPKEINMDSILLKKSQISNLSPKEQESLNDDRNFFHCILRKCIDELGITSIKGDNFTRLKSKVKEWVLNVRFDEADITDILKKTATKNIVYKNKRMRDSMSK